MFAPSTDQAELLREIDKFSDRLATVVDGLAEIRQQVSESDGKTHDSASLLLRLKSANKTFGGVYNAIVFGSLV